MDFGSGGNMHAKAWKDVWGAGQGTAPIDKIMPAAELISRLADEYLLAKEDLLARTQVSNPITVCT
jgi:nitronate monooxygenase